MENDLKYKSGYYFSDGRFKPSKSTKRAWKEKSNRKKLNFWNDCKK